MPSIGGVLIDVITDVNMKESSTTTNHALEDGEQITDHVNSDPSTISIAGTIYDDTDSRVLQLRKMREEGVYFNYDYMTSLTKVVITDFSRDYSAKTKDGYSFTMTLKQIKTVKVAGGGGGSPASSVAGQMASVSNAGRQQAGMR